MDKTKTSNEGGEIFTISIDSGVDAPSSKKEPSRNKLQEDKLKEMMRKAGKKKREEVFPKTIEKPPHTENKNCDTEAGSPYPLLANIRDGLGHPFSFSLDEVDAIENLLYEMQSKKKEVEEIDGKVGGVFSSDIFLDAFKGYIKGKEKELSLLILAEAGTPLSEVSLETDIDFSFREALLLEEVREQTTSFSDDISEIIKDKNAIPFGIDKYELSFYENDNLIHPFYKIVKKALKEDFSSDEGFSSIMSEVITSRLYSEDVFEVFLFGK